jgi:hypothetical protein
LLFKLVYSITIERNTPYRDILTLLNLPSSIIKCAAGEIRPPLATLDAPAAWYGFPPALIPVWSDGSGPTYIGYWKHWFVNREPCFVNMYVGAGRLTVEVARTVEQVFCLVSMMSISVRDGVETNLERFAKEVGVCNLDQIDLVSLATGDDPKGFLGIDQFKGNVPFESVGDPRDYTGHFPTGDFNGSRAWWVESCTFEIPQEILDSWPHNVVKPAWLAEGPRTRKDLFNEYLCVGNFANAWLTLNSSGWSISDARVAIADLSSEAKNAQFSVLAEAWLDVADESAGGY